MSDSPRTTGEQATRDGHVDIPVTGEDYRGTAGPAGVRHGTTDPTVAIVGGGVGGLTAAQELAERGFDVTVYEARDRFGGKARSMPGPQHGSGPALPAEHGFRFFPGFYRHLTDTMERIPYTEPTAADGGTRTRSGGVAGARGRSRERPDRSVADNLVACPAMQQATRDEIRTINVETPDSLADWRGLLGDIFGGGDVPGDESAYFVNRTLQLLTSCRARREDELEGTTWWEFIDAEEMSPGYRTFLGYGLTQSLVAMRPQVSSARTIGRIYIQLFRSRFDPDLAADRVLNGPSNTAWIDPWVRYLRSLGVDLRAGAPVTEIHADGRRVTGLTVDGEEVQADYYVAAVPVEVMRRLTTDRLARTAPSLRGLDQLDTAWMNGLQYYLTEEVPMAQGHSVYYDSPWALTAVSQREVWSPEVFDITACDEEVVDILSVIISEWDEPGIRYDKTAWECTAEELQAEVWAQLQSHLNADGAVLRDDMKADWFVDPELRFESTEDGTEVHNDSPLLINTVGSLHHRPDADTEAENLVLAADYVRTETDLASMEGANEAARRATNAILRRERGRAAECQLWEMAEPRFFEPFKRADRARYRLGLPHPGDGAGPLWRAYTQVRDGGFFGRE